MNYNISDIKQIKMLDILSKYMPNMKSKKTTRGLLFESCPFCQHKNHFSTYQSNYISFNSCCKGGSVIDFIMEIENLDFQDAIKFLGDSNNIPLNKKAYSKSTISANFILREEQRIIDEENKFLDYLRFIEDEKILNDFVYFKGDFIHYFYNLKAKGIVLSP